jgi:hypothetical protein
MNLTAPPHFDHWSTALVWLVTAIAECLDTGQWSDRDIGDDNPMLGGTRMLRGDSRYGMAYRAILRCHPLYERFAAANAVTEMELVTMLVDQAQGTERARKELETLPPCEITIKGLRKDLALQLYAHGLPLLPSHVVVDVDGFAKDPK